MTSLSSAPSVSDSSMSTHSSPQSSSLPPTSATALVNSLRALAATHPKLVTPTNYPFPTVPSHATFTSSNSSLIDSSPPSSSSSSSSIPPTATNQHILTSWRMPEHMYKADPCPLPTLARGLFTETVSSQDPDDDLSTQRPNTKETHRIVARGYEKFFNVDEMSYTKVSAEVHLVPIIFVSSIFCLPWHPCSINSCLSEFKLT